MGRIAGKNANFSFNSVPIEDELNSIEMAVDVNLPEVTAFADSAGEFLEGLPTSTFSVSGFWDGLASQGDATIFGQIGSGEAAYVFQPTGASVGANSPNYVGNALVKSYRVRAEVGGPVTYDSEFQVNGVNDRDVTP